MNIRMNSSNDIIRELQGILDNLCNIELSSAGREYIKKRIAVYKLKQNEAGISESATCEGANINR